ncbi:hypothetical protein JCM8097_001654 [Rhodosporidiobolus ruineniae]
MVSVTSTSAPEAPDPARFTSTSTTSPFTSTLERPPTAFSRLTFTSVFVFLTTRSLPAVVRFIFRTFPHWIAAVVVSPLYWREAGTTIFALAVFPVVWIALAVAALVFDFLKLAKGQRSIDWISKQAFSGVSMVNWLNPGIFGSLSDKAVDDAREYLEGGVATTLPSTPPLDHVPTYTTRIFVRPLARALLLMSALTYERPEVLVRKAAKTVSDAQRSHSPRSEPYRRAMLEARTALDNSETMVKVQAAQWGLSFHGIPQLTTEAGPYASIFYTPLGSSQKPFICLVFKGTTPSAFGEFLVDASITRIRSDVFFSLGGGTAHEGFYTNLFMTNDGTSAKMDGYGSIVRTLRHVAVLMKSEHGDKNLQIPLWVTGHSLGSALASLFFARLLRSTADLGSDLKLRDCYAFGTPRMGDGKFGSAFEEHLIRPIVRPNILWRVANHCDPVTYVPPGGFGDCESLRNMPESILNYAHFGPAVRLFPAGSKGHEPPCYELEDLAAFHTRTRVVVVDAAVRGEAYEAAVREAEAEAAATRTTIRKIGAALFRLTAALVPSALYDHTPASYLKNLDGIESTAQQATRTEEERDRGETGRESTRPSRLFISLQTAWEYVKRTAVGRLLEYVKLGR